MEKVIYGTTPELEFYRAVFDRPVTPTKLDLSAAWESKVGPLLREIWGREGWEVDLEGDGDYVPVEMPLGQGILDVPPEPMTGHELKVVMAYKGMGPGEMAPVLGLSTRTVYAWRNRAGGPSPSWSTVFRLWADDALDLEDYPHENLPFWVVRNLADALELSPCGLMPHLGLSEGAATTWEYRGDGVPYQRGNATLLRWACRIMGVDA